MMKEQLIAFLKKKTTTFSVEEVNQIIQIVSTLEEPKEKPKEEK